MARLTDQKIELTEDEKALLDLRLQGLADRLAGNPQVTVTYFQPDVKKAGGAYITVAGQLKKMDDFEGVLILADLTGGSPYNVSVRLKLGGADPVEVIGGASLPILLDAYMSRGMISDPAVLARSSLKAGKAQTICFEASSDVVSEDVDDEIELDE